MHRHGTDCLRERGMPMNKALDRMDYRSAQTALQRARHARPAARHAVGRRSGSVRVRRELIAARARFLGRGGQQSMLSAVLTSARRHFLLLPIVVSLMLLVASIALFTATSGAVHTVTLEHDGVTVQVESFRATVRDILQANGIVLGAHDRVTPGLDKTVRHDANIVIERAFAVQVCDGGQDAVTRYAVDGTVASLLDAYGYELGELDEVSPSLDSEVTANMTVQIDRIVHEDYSYTEEIAFETAYEPSGSLYSGTQKVSVEGVAGEKIVNQTIVYRNGVEEERITVCEQVTREPVTQVILQGTRERSVPAVASAGAGVLALSDGTQLSYSAVYNGTATAYTYTGNNTATGTVPAYGTVAVDPSVIPLGTRMYIPGYGYCVARDTGGAIKGTRIDLFFESYAQAIRWGRRSVTIYILN